MLYPLALAAARQAFTPGRQRETRPALLGLTHSADEKDNPKRLAITGVDLPPIGATMPPIEWQRGVALNCVDIGTQSVSEFASCPIATAA